MDLDYESELLLVQIPLCDFLALFFLTFKYIFLTFLMKLLCEKLRLCTETLEDRQRMEDQGKSHFSRRNEEMIQKIEDKLVISIPIHLQRSLEFIHSILNNLHNHLKGG